MELEFEREFVHCYETVADVTLCQEETLEAIVPDACPDILRILEVYGQAFLVGKQARSALASVTGMIHASILYQPDQGEGVRRMEMSLPFTCQAEAEGITEQSVISASPRLCRAEARVLNPRKVLLRAEVAVDVTVYTSREYALLRGVHEGEAQGIQQLIRTQESECLVCVQEKAFSLAEQIRFQSPAGQVAQLMAVRTAAQVTESRLIGTKLILKGNAEVALILQEGGALSCQRETLPFSQVMEVPGAGEDSSCRIALDCTQLSCQPCGQETGCLELELELLAQVEVRSRRTLTLLEDLYSTAVEMTVQAQPHTTLRMVSQVVRPQSVRELVETGGMLHSVVDSWVTLGSMARRRDGEELVLELEAEVHVVCLNDQDELQAVQKTIPVACRLECPASGLCYCRCEQPAEVYAAPAAGGAEVRFNVDFQILVLSQHPVLVVAAAQLGEPRAKGEAQQPSVVLRLPGRGERLWDIAKTYGTTCAQILQANELEDGEHLPGRMLLIPKAR